jgi:hypothetical protein
VLPRGSDIRRASVRRKGRRSPGGAAVLERDEPILQFFETLQSRYNAERFAGQRGAEAHERRFRFGGAETGGEKSLEGKRS